MKTDAYTMCRGAGHIADKVSHLSNVIQAICKLYLSASVYQKRLQVKKGQAKQSLTTQLIGAIYKLTLKASQFPRDRFGVLVIFPYEPSYFSAKHGGSKHLVQLIDLKENSYFIANRT